METRVLGVAPPDSKRVGALFLGDSIYGKMVVIFRTLWFCITGLFMLLLRFIREHLLRIGREDGSRERCLDSPPVDEPEYWLPEFDDIFYQTRRKEEEDEEKEEDKFKFEFRFSFQNLETVLSDGEGSEFKFNSRNLENTWTSGEETADVNINNYRFTPERGLSSFIQHPETATFCIVESYVGDGRYEESSALSCTEKIDRELKERFLSVKSLEHSDSDEKENLEALEGQESVGSCEWEEACDREMDIEDGDGTVGLEEGTVLSGDVPLGYEREFDGISSSESISGDDGYSIKDLLLDYNSDDILSEREPDDQQFEQRHPEFLRDSSTLERLDQDPDFNPGVDKVKNSEEIEQLDQEINRELRGLEEEALSLSEELIDTRSELFSIYMDRSGSLDNSDLSVYLENDPDIENYQADDVAMEDSMNINSYVRRSLSSSSSEEGLRDLQHIVEELDLVRDGKQEDTSTHVLKKLEDVGEEEEDVLESLWEHHDLIEQLKMEIKKAKETKLPTILEESEILRTKELKPWKIDAKFLQENPMDDLHKFYKSYRERMRKFDILNYQKMYATRFLQLKDPLQSINTGKLTLATLFSENLWPCRRRKSKNDPTEKFLRELQGDLESVYIGQMCLSWEFLWWQYEKYQDLPVSNSRGGRQYNQVAGEFQQFQVVIQRFLEDEPSQGGRIPHFVKSRCTQRNLLQVPLVREDSKKDKMDDVNKASKVITGEELNYILESSIGILWRFIKSDKDKTLVCLKGLARNQTELQDPRDRELMRDIMSSLHKKEKKLKDLLRVGNCLVKRFKKPQEQRPGKDLFCSQVDLKLVSRVLEMSRITTEQLVWCHTKLGKITFSDRRLHRQTSFLLFPC